MRPAFTLATVLLALEGWSAPASAAVRCFTPERLAGRASDVAAFAAGPAEYRPTAVGYLDSDLYPLRVHYRREEDAGRVATVVLPAAETSWRVEMEEMGWPVPPSDGGLGGDERYDFYMTNEETGGGAYTYGTGPDVWPDDGWFSQASYIALDDRWISDADMLDYVSHELNHASQYTIDGWEWTYFVWEMTATAIEEIVADTGLYLIDVDDFQELPFASLLFYSYSPEIVAYDDWSYYEYGGSIFGLFLEERYGVRDGRTLLALWEGLAQGERVLEPDMVDGLDALREEDGLDKSDIYLEFAEWRLFAAGWDDGEHYSDGATWTETEKVHREADLALADAVGVDLQAVDPPYDLGVSYWVIDDGLDPAGTLTARATGDTGADWGLVVVDWPSGGGPAGVSRSRADGGTELLVDLPVEAGTLQRVAVGVANLGPDDLDADGDIPRRGFTLRLEWTAEKPGDDDTAPPDDDSTPADDDTAPGDDDTAVADDDDSAPAGDDDGADDDDAEACAGCGAGGGGGGGPVWAALAVWAATRRGGRQGRRGGRL